MLVCVFSISYHNFFNEHVSCVHKWSGYYMTVLKVQILIITPPWIICAKPKFWSDFGKPTIYTQMNIQIYCFVSQTQNPTKNISIVFLVIQCISNWYMCLFNQVSFQTLWNICNYSYIFTYLYLRVLLHNDLLGCNDCDTSSPHNAMNSSKLYDTVEHWSSSNLSS